jgi:hypothetical protein
MSSDNTPKAVNLDFETMYQKYVDKEISEELAFSFLSGFKEYNSSLRRSDYV